MRHGEIVGISPCRISIWEQWFLPAPDVFGFGREGDVVGLNFVVLDDEVGAIAQGIGEPDVGTAARIFLISAIFGLDGPFIVGSGAHIYATFLARRVADHKTVAG